MAFAETQKLTVQLDLGGNFQAKIGAAARSLQGFDRSTSRTQQSLSKFGRNIERGVVIGATAAAAGIGLVVKAAADYESAFAGVRKTVTATEPELKALSDGFREMSRTIPISASELARLGEAGGALGVPTAQLKEFVRVTALLGVTTNLTADEAADSLGVLGNVLHLTGAQYSQFASSLVALGNAGASTERDIVMIAERAGAAGALIGVSTQQILGFSSAVASLGIEAEAGGTAIQKFFIDSAKFVAAGGKDLKEMAKVAGTSGKAFQKAFKDDAGAALQDFLKGLGKLPQAAQLGILEDLGFNDARITRTLLGLANNTKLVGDQMGVANKAFAENTALTKEAEQRFNTFDSQIQITKNTLTDMAITIGSKLLPKITPLLKRLNEFVGKNQEGISKFGDDLASGFEKVADALGKVDWKPFIDGLKLSGDIAKTVIGAFRSLPEDLQKLVIAGFALNKVTGGLGTSLVKDIGGALLNNFAQRGSSPVNPLFVVDVTGGGAGGVKDVLDVVTKGGLITAVLKAGLLTVALPALAGLFLAGKIAGVGPFSDNTEKGNKRLPRTGGTTESISGKAQDDIVRVVFPGKELDDLVQAAKSGREAFREMLAKLPGVLAKATKKTDIAATIKDIVKQFVSRKQGDAGDTRSVLKALRDKLGKTHDPQLQRALKAAIHQVQAKLPGREFAAKQLAKADRIFHSSESTGKKIRDLQAIERSLKDHRLPAEAHKINARINAMKAATVAAQHGTTKAINDKQWALTAITNVAVAVTAQGITKTNRKINQYTREG